MRGGIFLKANLSFATAYAVLKELVVSCTRAALISKMAFGRTSFCFCCAISVDLWCEALSLCLYIYFLHVLPTAPLTHSLAKFIPGHLPDNSKVFASLHGLQPRHPFLCITRGYVLSSPAIALWSSSVVSLSSLSLHLQWPSDRNICL